MRITELAKEETRRRIVDAALEHFQESGFEAATTRGIAKKANIAVGTLFNYFASKEAIVSALAAEALQAADDDFEKRKRPGAPLEEDLFGHISAGLRRLKRHRPYVHVLIQVALSPFTKDGAAGSEEIRESHLARVQEILACHKRADVSPVAMQLYWTLYLGILAYWAKDKSPKQEDTLALVDQSVAMLCDWLARDEKPDHANPQE
jgi:AcrR family transcriptional regulator